MEPLSLVLCSYSYRLGDGIAHVDANLITSLDPTLFKVKAFVLRPDFPPGHRERTDISLHVSLADAFDLLSEELAGADVLHVNGPFDPVACNAAAARGVPGIVEVVHQMEPGGLHPAVDALVCVSERVRSIQLREDAVTITNGIDTERFSFKPGRRDAEQVRVVQVANACKALYRELGDVAAELDEPRLVPFMAGDRPARPGVPSLGVRRDMPAVYHDADLLFLLEVDGAFGLVFAEALACGTLPIVSGDSGGASMVRHGETGWIVPADNMAKAADVLSEAAAAVRSPHFPAMQRKGREIAVSRYGKPRMLAQYQALYARLGNRPRKAPEAPPAWMHLSLFAQLFRFGNPAALDVLERYITEPRPLEAYYARHPMGQAAITFVLRDACPALVSQGYGRLVRPLCMRLHRSRIQSPLLDAAEALAAR